MHDELAMNRMERSVDGATNVDTAMSAVIAACFYERR
jgi:hypothetical protein